ncbi:hypothetical protein P9H32_11380 [Pontiella sp. NLcol2]|uniref:Uncharacterized protein n=1 Tax=Pontiella agarivorans TaxID=3038953 RepID=A0ABU5MYE8_9BACT|nr:hypothetical protein [Pontiella agarivorans]
MLYFYLFFIISTNNSLAFYRAEQGRWISRDPVGELGGINLQGMSANDVANKIDTLGQSYGNPVSGPAGPVGPSDPPPTPPSGSHGNWWGKGWCNGEK